MPDRLQRGKGLGARRAAAYSAEVDDMDPFAIAARQFERSDVKVYYRDPVRFATECIDWRGTDGLTSYQNETLARLPIDKRIAVRGPHGLGKTTTNAVAVLWFALTRDAAGVDWKCPTTAGTWRQLEQYLWPEIRKWAQRLRWDKIGRKPFNEHAELLKLSLTLRYGQAFAVASSDPAKIEGAHADSILYVFDESKIISSDTFDAAEGAFSGAQPTGLPEAFGLAQSTPGEPNGRFFEIHNRKPGLTDWTAKHVTLIEAIAAGRVSSHWAEARKVQWGEQTAVFQNRVMGNFWTSDEDAVIPLLWVEMANERYRTWVREGRPPQAGRRVFGVDVARGGTDKSIIATRTGAVVSAVSSYNLRDTQILADHIQATASHPQDFAVIDVIGLGAGVVDYLRRKGRPSVIGFSASRKTKRRDRSGQFGFQNQRACMWWTMRQLLDPAFSPTLALPDDDELTGELTAPHWWITPGSLIAVEAKDDIRKRIGRSTDWADAVGHSLMFDRDFDEPNVISPSNLVPFGEIEEHSEGAYSWS